MKESPNGGVVAKNSALTPTNMEPPTPAKKRGRKRKVDPAGTTAISPASSTAGSMHSSSSAFMPTPTSLKLSGRGPEWDDFLNEGYNLHFVPPVNFFKHAPLANVWKEISKVGVTVEVPNPFVRCSRRVNWYATIVHFAGYKALIEFECLGVSPKLAAWMSFCSKIPRPLGYSDENKILLHPPHAVRTEYPDYLTKARELLSTATTINENHGSIIAAELKKCQKYPMGTILEVMDRDAINRMRVASVTSLIGDRIHVSYVTETDYNDAGFWFNCKSEYIHPVGWSQTVGHEIHGVPQSAQFNPISPEYFPKYPSGVNLSRGQMLETRHPRKPHKIVGASVYRVLKFGYFVVQIKTDGFESQDPLLFTYHVTSPYIFPCGFCEEMKIELTPPHEPGRNKATFNWNEYFTRHKTGPAPLKLLPKRPVHHFKPGMKFETAFVMEPGLLGPTTVRKVRGHLLYVSFDSWNSVNPPGEVWMDAESPDIYPLGFAELVGHEFTGKVEVAGLADIEERFREEEGTMSTEEMDDAPITH